MADFYGNWVDHWYGVGKYSTSSTDTTYTITLEAGFQSDAWGFDIGFVDCTTTVNGQSATTSDNSFKSADGATVYKKMASKSVAIDKTHSTQSIKISFSVYNHSSWRDGTSSGSTSISVPAKTNYAVSYNANGGSGAPANSTKWYGETLTLSSTKPTRTGYTFKNWNTKSDGTGTAYDSGASYTANATATLYAQWDIIKYTVSYNANGGSGAPGSQSKNYGATLTLSSIKPNRTGYTFRNWNTAANGSGTSYNSGGSYTANADATLYAQWNINSYSVSYNANGGSNPPSAQSGAYNTNITLTTTKPAAPGNVVTTFTVTYKANGGSSVASGSAKKTTSYTFSNWNTEANGSGTPYNSGASYKIPTSNTTLYARWTSSTSTTAIKLAAAPTRTGYTFKNWNTASNGSGTAYNAGTSYTPSANITLYAQWTINSYQVSYNANGGSGNVPSTQTSNYNTSITIQNAPANLKKSDTTRSIYTITLHKIDPSTNVETSTIEKVVTEKTTYKFSSWNSNSAGSGVNYDAGSSYTIPASNTTLYAKWTATSSILPIKLDVPKVVNYRFDGWFNELVGGECIIPPSDAKTTEYTPPFRNSGNVDLYAHWTALTYVIKYNANAPRNMIVNNLPEDQPVFLTAENVTISSVIPVAKNLTEDNSPIVTYVYQDNITQNESVKTGKSAQFKGWAKVPTPDESESIISPGSVEEPLAKEAIEVNLYAQWQTDSTGNDGIYLKIPSRTGYKFKGWYTLPFSEGTDGLIIPTETGWAEFLTDTILYAHWDLIPYNIKYNNNGIFVSNWPEDTSGVYGDILQISFTNSLRPPEGETHKATFYYKNGENPEKIVTETYNIATEYFFKEWNTEPDGSGVSYIYKIKEFYDTTDSKSGAIIITDPTEENNVVAVDLILYPQWIENFSAPNLYLPMLESQNGNQTFVGWYSTETYEPESFIGRGNSYYSLSNNNINLYAKWISTEYIVRYNANGGSNAPAETVSYFRQPFYIGDAEPVAPASKTYTVKFNPNFQEYSGLAPDDQEINITYTFKNWNSKRDGTGTSYNRGESYLINTNITLYAQWTVESDSNILPTLSLEGYNFDGWYKDSQCLVKFGDGGTEYVPNNDMTLYAKWSINTYLINYSANGGRKAPRAQTKEYDTDIELSTFKPTRSGYVFKNWNTKQNGSGMSYNSGALYIENEDVTLYAQWRQIETFSEWISDWETTYAEPVSVAGNNLKLESDTNVDNTKLHNMSALLTATTLTEGGAN